MKTLSDLFDITYGNKFDLNKMTPPPGSAGVNFVGRSNRKNGVSATVALLPGVPPYKAGTITVALGGTPLASFVQEADFYTAQNVAVLQPKEDFTFAEKLFLCLCIQRNRFRYAAFGREANRTLRSLLVPEKSEFPPWLKNNRVNAKAIASGLAAEFDALKIEAEPPRDAAGWTTVGELFSNQYGNSYELCNLKRDPGGFNFVSRRMGNNGVSARVARTGDELFAAGLLTVALSGNGVLETSVQPTPFYTGFHVSVLTPRRQLSLVEKLFYARAIEFNRFRYGFGRQANRSLPALRLPPLPKWVKNYDMNDAKTHVAMEVRNRFSAQSI